MEVVEANEALLSNFEVLAFLREQRKTQFGGPKGKRNKSSSVGTILLESLTRLEVEHCAKQTAEGVKDFIEAMEGYKVWLF